MPELGSSERVSQLCETGYAIRKNAIGFSTYTGRFYDVGWDGKRTGGFRGWSAQCADRPQVMSYAGPDVAIDRLDEVR
jgi:hypothetical protein